MKEKAVLEIYFEFKQSLIRNVNHNFLNISFCYDQNQVKTLFILSEISELEIEYIEDSIAILTANLGENIVLPPKIEKFNKACEPLDHVVLSFTEYKTMLLEHSTL